MVLLIGALKIINLGPNLGNIMSHLIKLLKEQDLTARNIKSLLRMGISSRSLGLFLRNMFKQMPALFSCNMDF